MAITLEWFGVATFRLTIGELVVFLDAYMDRVPAAPPVGLSAADVTRADFVLVGHSHFDHLAGAETIALNTGARIIGSHETCRVMEGYGVPRPQLVPSQGGERHRLAPDVTARVLPGLHSCTWAAGTVGFDAELRGLTGLCEDERASQRGLTAEIVDAIGAGTPDGDAIREHIASVAGSRHAGGALAYVIETRETSVFFQDTSGCWSGSLREAAGCGVAILAAAGRANLDGEPYEGTLAGFIADEAAALQPGAIVVCHHDDWMPPVTRDMSDVTPIREAVARTSPATRVVAPAYGEVISLG